MDHFWTGLVLGLVGGLHCAGMCGPLALALPIAGGGMASFVLGRLAYNAGRMITYGVLGLGFGLLGQTLSMAGFQRWFSIGLGVLLLAGLFASRRLALWAPVILLLNRLKGSMASLLQRRSLVALGILGLLNGLLPCGLVYVACLGAAGTGCIMDATIYMAAFGAGTVPMMLAISLSGKMVPTAIRLKMARAVPVAIFLVALLLILRGLSLGIPYISPDLSSGAGSCCHKAAAAPSHPTPPR